LDSVGPNFGLSEKLVQKVKSPNDLPNTVVHSDTHPHVSSCTGKLQLFSLGLDLDLGFSKCVLRVFLNRASLIVVGIVFCVYMCIFS